MRQRRLAARRQACNAGSRVAPPRNAIAVPNRAVTDTIGYLLAPAPGFAASMFSIIS
jgi:hypothetical protein